MLSLKKLKNVYESYTVDVTIVGLMFGGVEYNPFDYKPMKVTSATKPWLVSVAFVGKNGYLSGKTTIVKYRCDCGKVSQNNAQQFFNRIKHTCKSCTTSAMWQNQQYRKNHIDSYIGAYTQEECKRRSIENPSKIPGIVSKARESTLRNTMMFNSSLPKNSLDKYTNIFNKSTPVDPVDYHYVQHGRNLKCKNTIVVIDNEGRPYNKDMFGITLDNRYVNIAADLREKDKEKIYLESVMEMTGKTWWPKSTNGSRGYSGIYQGIGYDSLLELNYILDCLDRKDSILRSNKSCIINNKYKYLPDFEVNGNIIEIKPSSMLCGWNSIKHKAAKQLWGTKFQIVTEHYITNRKKKTIVENYGIHLGTIRR